MFNIDWSNYPSAACQEIEIIIPANYVADTCTWTFELTNIPSVNPGITVYATPSGDAGTEDLIMVTFSRNGDEETTVSASLAVIHSDHDAAVSPSSDDGEADKVTVGFSSGGFTGAGFTMRVVFYAIGKWKILR